MNYPMIFSLMALILSLFSCFYTAWRAVENSREHKGMILYSDTAAELAKKGMLDHVDNAVKETGEAIAQSFRQELGLLDKKIDEVASDITPNFEAAKAAIAKVNDMSSGLTALFSYDPEEVLRTSRNESRGNDR